MEIADFSSPETDSGRAWLQPIGQEYEVEEVHLLRNAHLALHPNITRFVFIKFLLFYTCALVQNISFCPQFSFVRKSGVAFIPWDACGTPTVKIRFGCTQNCKASQ